MLSNNGRCGLNNPSFLKFTSGICGSFPGTPLSSSSRIKGRVRKGLPPQNFLSYSAKYQPQLGSRFLGIAICVIPALPHISKATFRVAFGIVLSIVPTLGRPAGTGNEPAGNCMSIGLPSTLIVARGNG